MRSKKDVNARRIAGAVIGVLIAYLIIFGIEYLVISGVYALVCMAVDSLEFSWFNSLVITFVLMILSGFFRPKNSNK